MSDHSWGSNLKELSTAASVISFISKIELDSAELYEQLGERYGGELKEVFLSFANDNKKNEKSIKRAYYSVISDALETNFCFKGLVTGDVILPFLTEKASSSEALKASIKLENSIQVFYLKAAETSKSLLADVPRAIERVAKSRKTRLEKLSTLLEAN